MTRAADNLGSVWNADANKAAQSRGCKAVLHGSMFAQSNPIGNVKVCYDANDKPAQRCQKVRMSDLWNNNIARWRRSAGLTLEQLADALVPPTTKGTISQYETGKRAPSQKRLLEIAKVLGTTPGALINSLPASAETTPLSSQPWSPKASTVAALLEAVRPSLLATGANGADLGIVAHNIAAALRQIAREPSIEDNEDQLRLVCDFVADRVQLDMSATG